MRDDSPPARPALAASVAVGVLVLALSLNHFARSRPVAGPLVRSVLRSAARQHDLSLVVGDIEPAGLMGLRLIDVAVRTSRGPVRATVHADTAEIRPSLSALLRGAVAPARIDLRGGTIRLEPTPSDGTSNDELDPRSEGSTATASSPEPARPALRQLTLGLDDVHVRTPELGALTPAPVVVRRAKIELRRRSSHWSLHSVAGWGRIEGDRRFSIARRNPPDELAAIRIDFASPLRIDHALGLDLPGHPTAESLVVCPRCSRRRICARELAVSKGTLRATAGRACSRRGSLPIAFDVRNIELTRDRTQLPLACSRASATVELDPTRVQAKVRCSDGRDGNAALRANWSPGSDSARLDIDLEDFSLGGAWGAVGIQDRLQGGRASGEWTLRGAPSLGVLAYEGNLTLEGLSIRHPLVGRHPIAVDRARVDTAGTVDLEAGAIGLRNLSIRLGQLHPFRISGTAVRAPPGWDFELTANAHGVDAPALKRTLPRVLARPALGANLTGEFDVAVSSSGHTGIPGSLSLDVEIDGDVDVLRESPNTPVTPLASTGPAAGPLAGASVLGELDPNQWVALEDLPDHVTRTILAAEDVDFYSHDGVDWTGIRNALVHNLRVDDLERGGSTITQQLAKNLFLNQRRTLARKLRELWVTWRLESILPKRRILELYLNIVEWGAGVRGLREAAEHYFDTRPEALGVGQTALLAAILPGPHLFGRLIDRGRLPVSRVVKIEHILSNLRYLGVITDRRYEQLYASAEEGQIGGLSLELCGTDPRTSLAGPPCDAGAGDPSNP
ncbi:MAG: transglycosylase domain-containing protein [Bradymonadaceae bacterium]